MTAPQAPRDGAAVEFHGVAFSYADAEGNLFEPVLKGVSLSVARGQCVVVTGCSGCGKTTLMRLVNGLVPQAYDGELSGTVCVLGQDAADLGIEGLSLRVGSVFQNPRSQFFNLDTTSEIAFGCENAGLPHDEIRLRVRSAAADLGISHPVSYTHLSKAGKRKLPRFLTCRCATPMAGKWRSAWRTER